MEAITLIYKLRAITERSDNVSYMLRAMTTAGECKIDWSSEKLVKKKLKPTQNH